MRITALTSAGYCGPGLLITSTDLMSSELSCSSDDASVTLRPLIYITGAPRPKTLKLPSPPVTRGILARTSFAVPAFDSTLPATVVTITFPVSLVAGRSALTTTSPSITDDSSSAITPKSP